MDVQKWTCETAAVAATVAGAAGVAEIFGLLRDGEPRTRAQLAEATGLARSTVAARVDVLTRLGLVRPHGGVSTGGRPPSLFALNPAARVVAGVDVGATHVTAALADLSGAVLTSTSTRLDVADGPEPVLRWVCAAITRLLRRADRPDGDLAAIGIGLPGPVEHETGRAISPPIMPGWDRFDVPARVAERHAVPVLVDNDVNIMAWGERQAHLPDVEDLLFVKVATGIGAGLVAGGRLQRGAQGTAGDIGHVLVPGGGAVRCRCGNEGCLEAIAAGPALADRLRQEGVEAADAGDVVALVRAGNLPAIRVVRQAGRDIGGVLATCVNLVNPSVVVIGGILAEAGEHLIAGIREVVYPRSLALATERLLIEPSRAGAQAGVLGACALAIDHTLAPSTVEAATLELVGSP